MDKRGRLHSAWSIALASAGVIIGGILSLLLGVFVGYIRGSIELDNLRQYEQYIGRTVILQGRMADDPDIDESGLQVLKLSNIHIDGGSIAGARGLVRVTTKSAELIRRSDTVLIHGKLSKGFGTFSGTLYRGDLLSVFPSYDFARDIRDWFVAAIRRAVPEPQSSLGVGFLVGQKSALPNDLLESLQIAGLTHIVVASGYNLTILVRFCRRLLMRFSKFTAFLGSATLVVLMIGVTGLSPSMSRAGLVAGISLLVWYYGRSMHPLVILPFAAAITALLQPSYLWGDMGWMLSFSAFAGVMILAPLLQRFFFGNTQPGTIRQILGETVAAHMATLPIIIGSFGVVSNVAIFANLMIVPLVPLAMMLTFFAGVGALITPIIADIVGRPAEWLLSYMISTADWWANLSWSQREISVSWEWVVIGYIALAAVCMILWRVTKFSWRNSNLVQ